MFEWMHKYRIPILVTVLLGLFGFGAWGAIQQLFTPNPAAEEVASFVSPTGETITLTRGDQAEFLQMIRYTGQGSQFVTSSLPNALGLADRDVDTAAINWRILYEAGKASGVIVPKSVIEEQIEKQQAQSPAGSQKPADDFIDFQVQLQTISRWRQAYMSDPAGPTYDAVYEDYKKLHPTLAGRYVLFEERTPESFTLDITDEADLAKLKTWYEESGQFVKASNPVLENVDLEVAYVLFKDLDIQAFATEFESRFAAHTADMDVPEEEVRRRYDAFGSQYREMLRKEQERRKAAGGSTEDQPDEFETLKPHLVRELKTARLLKKVMDAVQAAGNDQFQAIAEAHGFRVAKVEKKDQGSFMRIPEFGSVRAWQNLRAQAIDKLKVLTPEGKPSYELGAIIPYVTSSNQDQFPVYPTIFDEPSQFQALYRMLRHEDQREPNFEEIVGKVLTAWQTAQVQSDLSTRARAFRDRIDSWIKENVEAVRTKAAELEVKRNEAVEKQIADRSLSREKPEDTLAIKGIELQADGERDRELQPLLKEHQARAYEAVVQEMDLQAMPVPPIVRSDALSSVGTVDDSISRDEKLSRLARSRQVVDQLYFLDVGGVSQPVPQPTLKGIVVVIADQKTEPPAAEMILFPSRIQASARGLAAQPDRTWGYEVFKRPDYFSLKSKSIDKRREEERKAQEARAQRQAESAARRAAAAQAKEEAERQGVTPPVGPPPPNDR